MPITYYPSREEFRKKAKQGNTIPVWRELLADTETPVSAFYKVAYGRQYGFLLESVEGGERMARYSFIGSEPFLVFRSKNNRATIEEDGKTTSISLQADKRDPLHVLKEIMGRYHYVAAPELPPFVGGAVGMIGYDTVRFFENLPDLNPDDLNLDDCLFMLTDALVVFDLVKHRMLALCNARVNGDPDKAYDAAIAKIDEIVQRLHSPFTHPPKHKEKEHISMPQSPLARHGERGTGGESHTAGERARVGQAEKLHQPTPFVSNLSQPEYEALVLRAKEYIAAGDSFQIQVSRRQAKKLAADPFDVYRALRSINPSPYMFYLVFGDIKLIGASPEILVTEKDGLVCIRPLAGTRPRGASDVEDAKIAADLLADEKERAEHVMLVDLGRNDIGRVAKFGTVRVEELMVIEKYSHVLHIVSDVKGELKEGLDQFDVLRASFPAGTLTGAPKVRTMEIIEELEPTRRGFYGGGIGYFSFSGNMDTAITIRTALVKKDTIYIQAAGGIVADSDPSYEYRETAAKMRALVRAVEWAEEGLE